MFDEDHVFYRYKYLPLDEGSLKTLTEGTIKFTCPLAFNDPFDCMPYYETSRIHKLNEHHPDLLKAIGDSKGLSPAKRIQQKGPIFSKLKRGLENGSFARKIMADVGVVSLSKNALSILMWSHYADFHKGMVLEFRIPFMGIEADAKYNVNRLLPFPVDYLPDRPRLDLSEVTKFDSVKKLVLTKSEIWKYEDEERVIDHTRPPGIYSYNRDEILCTVIAGLKMTADNFEHLDKIVKNLASTCIPNLRLFKATEKNDAYELEVQNHPRLGVDNP